MCFQKNPANIPCKQAFNLDRLPTLSLKNDFAAYIFDRGCTLSYSSLRTECVQFHTLSDFLSEEYPYLTSLTNVPLETMQGSLKRWLLKKGLALSYKTSHPDRKKETYGDNPVLHFLTNAYQYFEGNDGTSFFKNHTAHLKRAEQGSRLLQAETCIRCHGICRTLCHTKAL